MISAIAGSGEPSNRHQPVAVLLQVSPLISMIAALLPAVTMSRPAVGRMLKCCYEVIVSKVIDTDIVTQSFDLRQGFFSTSTKDKIKLKFELIFPRASYCSGMGRPARLERGLAQGAARTAADAKLALGPPDSACSYCLAWHSIRTPSGVHDAHAPLSPGASRGTQGGCALASRDHNHLLAAGALRHFGWIV